MFGELLFEAQWPSDELIAALAKAMLALPVREKSRHPSLRLKTEGARGSKDDVLAEARLRLAADYAAHIEDTSRPYQVAYVIERDGDALFVFTKLYSPPRAGGTFYGNAITRGDDDFVLWVDPDG